MLENLSPAELKKLIADAEAQKSKAEQRDRQRVREHLESVAKAEGYSIRELFGVEVRAKAAVKYRDGAGNTWSGRGKRPVWLRDAINGGATLESFAV